MPGMPAAVDPLGGGPVSDVLEQVVSVVRENSVNDWKHPNDMGRDELRELVSAMSWMALDLAQHLHFTNNALREEFRSEAYQRACEMAYELEKFPYDGPRKDSLKSPGVAIFGEGGLRGWT